jgi:tetratricopeptide (TPR) repeat protein
MKGSAAIFIFLTFILMTAGLYAQTDDCRNMSGLPIPIGQPIICGRVKITGVKPGDVRPTIDVTLLVGGVQADRMRTNDSGFYYFLKAASNNSQLLFEVDHSEIGRVPLAEGVGSSVRRDIELDIGSIRSSGSTPPGVISARSAYKRSADNEKDLSRALDLAKAKKNNEAVSIFKAIVDRDGNDFVTWTELGTSLFNDSKYEDAEQAYTKALALKPDFMPALMNLGKLYLAQKKFDKSAAVFYRSVMADPRSADAFHYLGEAFLQTKEGNKAVIALNEALRLEPVKKAEIHLRLATLYNAAGAKDRAAAEYKAFLAKTPNYPDKEKLEKYIQQNAKQ